jgi:hypothetical protein
LARLGWAGVIGYASGFFEPAASHLPASPFHRNEGLLGQTPSAVAQSMEWTDDAGPQPLRHRDSLRPRA